MSSGTDRSGMPGATSRAAATSSRWTSPPAPAGGRCASSWTSRSPPNRSRGRTAVEPRIPTAADVRRGGLPNEARPRPRGPGPVRSSGRRRGSRPARPPVTWTNDTRTVWFADWQAPNPGGRQEPRWHADGLTAFAGRLWPRRDGWSGTAPIAAELAQRLRERPLVGTPTRAVQVTVTDGTHEPVPRRFHGLDRSVIRAPGGPVDVVVRRIGDAAARVCPPSA